MRNCITAGLIGIAFAGMAGVSTADAAQATPEQNKEVVRTLMQAFARRDADTIARYTGDEHSEHNANLARNGPCGKTCLVDFVRGAARGRPAGAAPEAMRPLRFLAADQDFVIAMFDEQPANGIQLEVFRLKDGKMVEHWIAHQ